MDIGPALDAVRDQVINGIVPHTVTVVAITGSAWYAVRLAKRIIDRLI